MLFLDTHVAVWLYADASLVPRTARALIESERPFLSPMAALEIQYLFEIGRVKTDSRSIIVYLSDHIGLVVESATFAEAVLAARAEAWTRDPFDRIIASHARLLNATLLSKDKTIASAFEKTVWS